MFFVKRNVDNKIVAIADVEIDGCDEQLAANHPDIIGFLKSASATQHTALDQLQDSDVTLIRVLEDMINLLVKKNIIQFTELPEAAQEKLTDRKQFRSMLLDEMSTDNTLLTEQSDDDSLI
ncbi:hypothetical protein [Echinimonas agarilytica]|uniref:Tryptophan synthase subunit beta like protein n=1 Tax=Echinimonas agarilytica TaxID=1215918 RepID=A0AA41W8E1_9GAMM|nr:hypothetical protein [Echinimonas agarilytica]MCM2680331.1 hypothetical protein [Echinimonas agarilytica]